MGLQGIYDDLLKFSEGRAARPGRLQEVCDFKVELARGATDAYTQGWEDRSYAVKELHQITMMDPADCTVEIPFPPGAEASSSPPAYHEEPIPARFLGEANSSMVPPTR